ncbi:ABC transporter permease [Dactylosporangium sp. CA-139114]|uniref:ABC transporter permease n=1 Tax=Dactylosporangium sp. CA-139114 TaxID=3239931 RepID=UPI003D96F19B
MRPVPVGWQEARAMAYDDSRFRGEPGFREEPDFRSGGVPEDAPTLGVSSQSVYTPGSFPVSPAYGSPAAESSPDARRRPPTVRQLGDVFDDPEHGEPGRDRYAVHALWELVLLLAAGALLYLLRDASPAALRGAELRALLLSGAELGLVAVAAGLTLRAGAPNLALGPIAFAAALFFAKNADRGLLMTAAITGLIAVGVGVVIAVLVVAFHVPGWAASLGAALALIAWITNQPAEKLVAGAYDPHPHAMWWAIGVAVLAAGGGALGVIRPLRRGLGRFRPVHDPADRRGGGAATFTGLALAGSALLAAVGGVLVALDDRGVAAGDASASFGGFTVGALALGAALAGGTSAFGRRGGVLGTLLAVAVITLLLRYTAAEGWKLQPVALAAGAIGLGLVVTRLVETFGRPRTAAQEAEEAPWTPPPITTPQPEPDDNWSPPSSRTGSWPATSGYDTSRDSDRGWGVEERWGTR